MMAMIGPNCATSWNICMCRLLLVGMQLAQRSCRCVSCGDGRSPAAHLQLAAVCRRQLESHTQAILLWLWLGERAGSMLLLTPGLLLLLLLFDGLVQFRQRPADLI